jgi:hypothetical protein
MQIEKNKLYLYKDRIITVIQINNKSGRVEIIDADQYKPGLAGFFINSSELKHINNEKDSNNSNYTFG